MAWRKEQAEIKAQEELQGCTFTPQLVSPSATKKLAKKAREKEIAKQRELRKSMELDQVPSHNRSSSQSSGMLTPDPVLPNDDSPNCFSYLHNHHFVSQSEQERRRKEVTEKSIATELEECTFTPAINESSKTMKSVLLTSLKKSPRYNKSLPQSIFSQTTSSVPVLGMQELLPQNLSP
jgi:hypothetical protein